MKQLAITTVVCVTTIFAAIAAFSAIDLTTPEVIPAKQATKAQVTEIRLRFYTDGQNMLMRTDTITNADGSTAEKITGTAEGYVEWRTGNGDAPNFQAVTAGKSVTLTAEDLAAIMALAKQAKPAESDALVTPLGITPVDQLFQAIVQYIKSKGKM